MVLTLETLKDAGFLSNHPENVLAKYYLASPKTESCEWRIMIEQDYLPGTNVLNFNVNMWKTNERGAIVKRASLSDCKTTEDLNTLISLCEINFTLNN